MTESAPDAVEKAVMERLPARSRKKNLTPIRDDVAQFTSTEFIETPNKLGITHWHTAYHDPEINGYLERLHCYLREEEVCTAGYRSMEEARANIVRQIQEYNSRKSSISESRTALRGRFS